MEKNKCKLCFILMAGVVVMTMMSACTEELLPMHNTAPPPAASPQSDETISTIPALTPSSSIESAKYFKKLSENVIVDADVNYGDMQKYQFPSVMVERKHFDIGRIRSIFFLDYEPEVLEADGRTIFTGADMQLNIGEGEILFETQLSKYLQEFVVTDEGEFKTIDHYRADSLDFMSKNEAIRTATILLDQLGIQCISEPLIYALDDRTLQAEQDVYAEKIEDDEWLLDMLQAGKIKLKDKWTAADECYYIIFNANINDLPVDSMGYMLQQSDGIHVDGSRIEIIVSKNGVSYCSAGVIYEIMENTQAFPIIQLDEALDYVKNRYEQIILYEPITIEHISLMYCPVLTKIDRDSSGSIITQEYEMVPAWILKAKQMVNVRGETRLNDFRIIINALTGEFIE